MPNPTTSKSACAARRSAPSPPKSSSTTPDAKSATSIRPTQSSSKSTQPASPIPIPESPQSSPMPFQSLTTRPLFKKKNDSLHDGLNSKVLIIEETLIGYVHNLSPPRRNRGNTMNYCTFVLQTSAQDTLEALLYSTHKRPLLLESQNNHTPVKLKHFTYTKDRDKNIVNDMTNIAIPQQCEYSSQHETTLLQGKPITILDILNTHKQWDIVIVRGKILKVKDQRSVGSPRK